MVPAGFVLPIVIELYGSIMDNTLHIILLDYMKIACYYQQSRYYIAENLLKLYSTLTVKNI